MTVTGLVNGTTYEFQVNAGNSGGDSAWSASVNLAPAATAAAPTVASVSTGFNNLVGNQSFSVAKPTGLATNDLLVGVMVGGKASTGVSIDNGPWTAGPTVASAGNNGIWTFSKRVTNAASEPANYIFSWTTAGRAAGALIRVSGASLVDPAIEASSSSASAGAGSASAATSSVTTLGPNRLLLALAGVDAKPALSTTTGITTTRYNFNTGAGINTHYTALGGDATQAAAGASAAMAYNYAAAQQWTTALLAVRPVAPSATPTGLAATSTYGAVKLAWNSVAGATATRSATGSTASVHGLSMSGRRPRV